MGKERKQWTENQIKSAIFAIRTGESIGRVSRRTGIPKTTLWDKLTGKRPMFTTVGRSTILTSEEEKKIVEWISQLNNRGFPITKTQLLNNVSNFVKKLNRANTFINNRPSRNWYENFLRRHPDVSCRIAQNLNLNKLVTKEKLQTWFEEIKVHLDKIDTLDGSRVFNLNEFTVFLCPEREKVFNKKREKSMKSNTQEDEKQSLTVVLITNALGMLVPPMALFNYKRIPYSIKQSAASDWTLDKSTNGRLSSETLLNYVTNNFHQWLTKQNIQRPIVLYIDDHSSHVTYPLLEFCSENQIELIALYPNSSHILMPLDVALFKPLTEAWRKSVSDFNQNQNKIRIENYCHLLESALNSLNLQEIMSDGFRKTGLYPFSPDALKSIELLNITNPRKVIIEVNTEEKQYVDEAKKFLLYCERFIDSTVLQEFKKAKENEEWTGELRHKSLFRFWSSILKCSRDVTTKNDVSSNDSHKETSETQNKNIVFCNVDKTKSDGSDVRNQLLSQDRNPPIESTQEQCSHDTEIISIKTEMED